VDGTSIDTLAETAVQLGLEATQRYYRQITSRGQRW
jgi:hypothetical protein